MEAFKKLKNNLIFELQKDVKIGERKIKYQYFKDKFEKARPTRDALEEMVKKLQ